MTEGRRRVALAGPVPCLAVAYFEAESPVGAGLAAEVGHHAWLGFEISRANAIRWPGCPRRILELTGEGLTNRQIGERMFLAEKAVKIYTSALFAKLAMERRTDKPAGTYPGARN
jgi:Bacterial regulatory proteins, luxR family